MKNHHKHVLFVFVFIISLQFILSLPNVSDLLNFGDYFLNYLSYALVGFGLCYLWHKVSQVYLSCVDGVYDYGLYIVVMDGHVQDNIDLDTIDYMHVRTLMSMRHQRLVQVQLRTPSHHFGDGFQFLVSGYYRSVHSIAEDLKERFPSVDVRS